MTITDHAHAAIVSLTQYESANYHNDLNTARGHLLDTMRHVVAISKLTPAKPDYRLPQRWENTDRLCMYMRCMDALTAVLFLQYQSTFNDPRNHLGNAWVECSRLAEHHGWLLPALPGAPAAIATERPLLARR